MSDVEVVVSFWREEGYLEFDGELLYLCGWVWGGIRGSWGMSELCVFWVFLYSSVRLGIVFCVYLCFL